MSTRSGAVVYVTADVDGLLRGLHESERAVDRFADKSTSDLKRVEQHSRKANLALGALKTGAVAAGVAVGATMVAGVRTGWRELLEQQKVSAQTTNVLRNYGKQTDVTRKSVEDLASKLQGLTGVADDQIQAAQNQLLVMAKLGNEVLPRATRSALDLSKAFDRDLTSTTRILGKALADPEKGLSALSRIGVKFTAEQKEQIKTWQAAGETAKAQALILREVESRTKGAAEAYGKTLPGQIDRAKRAWEEFSEDATRAAIKAWPRIQRVINSFVVWFRTEILPDIRDIVRNISEFWDRHREDILRVWRTISVIVRTAVQNIASALKIITAILSGDWSEAWKEARQMVSRTLNAIVTAVRNLGTVLLNAARAAGRAIGQGLVEGIRSIPGSGALLRALGIDSGPSPARVRAVISPGGGFQRRATGGYIPGAPGAGDVVPILAAPGEVVLNERQQRLLGPGRIARVLAVTGGVMGGRTFAAGGIVGGGAVTAAAMRASGNLGEPYGKPSRGESRTGPNSWDCSGYATFVAGVNVGGTTASAYQQSTAVRDHARYPIVWGFRKSHSGGYRGGYDEHMGVRVGGVWYQTSGGRTARTGSDSDWSEIRVPRGLERLTDADAGGPGDASTGGGRGGGASSGTLGGLTLRQARAALRVMMRGGGVTAPGLTDTPSIERRHADDSLQERRMTAAGAPRSQILATQKHEYEQDIRDLTTQIRGLVADRNDLRKRRSAYRKEILNRKTTPQRRLRLLEAINGINEELTGVNDAIRTLVLERASVRRQAAILGYDIQEALSDEDAAARSSFAPSEAPAGGNTIAPTETGPSYVDILNANTAALNGEFFRTVFGAGDIGTGGRTALEAAMGGGRYVTIRVEANSFAGAVASSSGDQGYIQTAIVPSGV